jgi:transposase
VLAQSQDRVKKERAMRRRQLKGLFKRLRQLQKMDLQRDDLLLKLGQAKHQFRTAWRLVEINVNKEAADAGAPRWSFQLRKDQLRVARRREGRYLLRSNLSAEDPAGLWQLYIELTHVEAAFKNLKDDLSLRPLFHQLEKRIEAHIFVAFLAYCLHVSLRAKLRLLAPGLTARSVLDKFAALQMLDVHLPTTDGRELVFSRYTQPEKDQKMLLTQLKWELPPQSPPRISQKGEVLKD